MHTGFLAILFRSDRLLCFYFISHKHSSLARHGEPAASPTCHPSVFLMRLAFRQVLSVCYLDAELDSRSEGHSAARMHSLAAHLLTALDMIHRRKVGTVTR